MVGPALGEAAAIAFMQGYRRRVYGESPRIFVHRFDGKPVVIGKGPIRDFRYQRSKPLYVTSSR